MSLKRRIERIEAAQLKNQHDSPSQNSDAADERKIDARRYMMRHLRLVAAGRRGELGLEEAAQVEAMNAAAERRFAKMRG